MSKYTIRGQMVSDKDRRPLIGFRVEARAEDYVKGTLGAAVSDASGHFKIVIDERFRKILKNQSSDVSFSVFVGEEKICEPSELSTWNPRKPNRLVVLALSPVAVSRGESKRGRFDVKGRVTDERGVALEGARVEVVDLGLEGETVLGEVVTDGKGRYLLAYDPAVLKNKALPDLFIRVSDSVAGTGPLASSDVHYRAGTRETIDLSVESKELTKTTEYERLLDAIGPHLGEFDVGDLSPEGVTHVANKSGWDARAVAMAAKATKLGRENDVAATHYYALFRAGVAGDQGAIDKLSTGALERALKAAVKRRIIAEDHTIAESVAKHRRRAAATLGEMRTEGGMATLGEMLKLSLPDADQDRFLRVFLEHGDRPATLWQALADDGLDDTAVARLQTGAKLGQMSLQNRALVARVLEHPDFDEPADLVRLGLYDADAWHDLIGDDVPDGITKANYADGLAAQVNLSYPSLVTSELVRRDEIPLGSGSLQAEVADFFTAGDAEKTIGVDPIKTWDGYDRLSAEAQTGARAAERMFQMSPSNGSMVALAKNGLESAHRIMSHSKAGFMTAFGSAFSSEDEAERVYHKAQEIHATTLGVAITYITERAAPNVYTITGKQERAELEIPADVPGAATLEELFVNMDYCACEHCKSVLSPAAYLVELLQFIDVTEVLDPQRNPIDVLLERRPDLQHIQLSCENTNIVLPYVDIVNEILEHYITNGNLDSFPGFNMSEDSSSLDLLADPEFVADAAYVETKSRVYPWNLPFDMPLEALRLLFQHLDVSLADAWSTFRTAADARKEAIGLSPEEVAILTDTSFRNLPEYFGEPAAASISDLNDAVANGKKFSRRTAISHQELVSLLKTRFINPGYAVAAELQQLGLSLETLQKHFEAVISDAELLALLPGELDLSPFGDDVPQWLADHREQIMGMITLTDVSPEPVDCDFAQLELRLALPDMAANRLTALEYHKLLRFIRLWKKLDWSLEATDELVVAFLDDGEPADLTLANLDASFVSLLDRVGNFLRLASRLSLSGSQRAAWLRLWSANEEPALRRDRLARLLRIGSTDLEHLSELAGVDPLADDMAADQPSILTFVETQRQLKALRLKVTDLNYLFRNSDDTGTLTTSDPALLRDVKNLRDALTAVEAQLRASPESLDLAYVQAKVALVYDTPIVERFFALLDDSSTYTAPFVTIAEEVLPQKLVDASLALGYDPFARQLTFTGVMSAAAKAALDAAADALTLADVDPITDQVNLDGLISDFKVAAQALFNVGAADLQALGDEGPELKAAYDAASVLQDPEAQATTILDAVLLGLRRQLKENALRTGLAKILGVDVELLDAMLAVTQANNDAAQGALSDFLALESPVVFAANGSHEFYLDPPSQDDYILSVRAPENTTVTLTLGGDEVIPATAVGATGELRSSAAIALEAGTPLAAELALANLPAGESVALSWQARGIARQPVPGTRLYAGAGVAQARASLLRLRKASMLSQLLGLTPTELRHFAGDNVATVGFVDLLPVDGVLAGVTLDSLWQKVSWLMWFADWRRTSEPEENTFVRLLEQPDLLTPQGDSQLARANSWSAEILTAVLSEFSLALPDLSTLANLRRVVDAMGLASDARHSSADLVAWSTAVPDAALITSAKASLRERLGDTPWRELLQGVNDELRNRRLDALVSFILHHQQPAAGVDTPERLYEHFLVDVQMDACRQTSRIRQALSSIQLFVTRCLMNLESEVAASSIREDHWQWMKRYRVWEANRKVFLYPENWLEPELRDGKSPFFRELEGELLKSDITQELAEDAYFNYLKKLDEVARLEIVGTYLEERTPGKQDDDILHVVGRTNGNTREHYYRRFERGYWMPWEKVTLNIEGDHVVLAVWKSQLFLFWVTVLEKADPGESNSRFEDVGDEAWGNRAKKTVEIGLGWGEYFKGKWTSPKSTKSTEMNRPLVMSGVTTFIPEKLWISVETHKLPSLPPSEQLIVSLRYFDFVEPNLFLLTFTSKNTPPISEPGAADSVVFQFNLTYFSGQNRAYKPIIGGILAQGNQLAVSLRQAHGPEIRQELLTKSDAMLVGPVDLTRGFRVRPLWHNVGNQWEAPFFVSDEQGVFLVSGDEQWHFDLKRKVPAFFLPATEVKLDVHIPDLDEVPEDPLRPGVSPVGDLVSRASGNVRVIIGGTTPFELNGSRIGSNGVIADASRRN